MTELERLHAHHAAEAVRFRGLAADTSDPQRQRTYLGVAAHHMQASRAICNAMAPVTFTEWRQADTDDRYTRTPRP